MTKTTNYQLNQWAKSDRIMMDDFNADNQKIDAALAEMPRIVTGTYVGTGEYGASHPNTLAFDFAPKAIFVGGNTNQDGSNGFAIYLPIMGAIDYSYSGNAKPLRNVSVNERQITWYDTDASRQYNVNGRTYYWIAIG